jgi:heme A synthase
MEILKYAHSGLRWVVLALLIGAIINAITGKSRTYEKKDKMLNLFAMVSLHIQLLLGLVLYFTSENVVFKAGWMKVDKFRFYGMEHILMMVIAIVLVTIGRKKAEKQSVPAKKFKTIALWYTIALLIIIAAIPWPFREALGGKWF